MSEFRVDAVRATFLLYLGWPRTQTHWRAVVHFASVIGTEVLDVAFDGDMAIFNTPTSQVDGLEETTYTGVVTGEERNHVRCSSAPAAHARRNASALTESNWRTLPNV